MLTSIVFYCFLTLFNISSPKLPLFCCKQEIAKEEKPQPLPLSECQNPSQPPPRGRVPNRSKLGDGRSGYNEAMPH
ncbi:hypothetical protein HMPREF0973_00766 [Prevotella veroralis F0319]|uniref:Uncharacterized protein n=1 Tax=Prevotella veroralis F0319 TaxID=649761 RepID=C9MMD6_9BACT|nr:hypothetical protein HMPREF0973_00766 [Prevotella veroralis F0319]